MSYKIIAAVALSLGLATSALAQTGTGSTTGGADASGQGAADAQTAFPTGWSGPISEAFFSDTAAGTMRTEDEIRTNWGNLSAEQQAQVRTDCESHMAAHGTDSTMQTGSTTGSGDNTAVTATGSEGEATGGTTLTAMNDVCGIVQGM